MASLPKKSFPKLYEALGKMTVAQLKGRANKEYKSGCKVKDDYIEATLNTIAHRHVENPDYKQSTALYSYSIVAAKNILAASPTQATREWVEVVMRFWIWAKGTISEGSRVKVISGDTYLGQTGTVHKANPQTCLINIDGATNNPTGNIYYYQLELSATKAPKDQSRPDASVYRRRKVGGGTADAGGGGGGGGGGGDGLSRFCRAYYFSD